MKNKLLYILPILIATILVTTSLGSAAIALNTPLSGSNWSTTINFNCTKLLGDSPVNTTNATLWYNATGGSAGTYLASSKIVNDSLDDTYFYLASISTSGLSDLKTYNFSCKTDNGTAQGWSPGRTAVAIDTVAPVITFDVKQKSINPNGLIEAKCSYTDATTGTTSSSYFNYTNPAGTQNSLTADGTYQSVSNEKTAQEGSYTFTCYAVDYSENSATSTATTTNTGFTINLTSQQTDRAGIPRWLIFAVIGVLIYLAVTSKKK